jgi:hypothetical protein
MKLIFIFSISYEFVKIVLWASYVVDMLFYELLHVYRLKSSKEGVVTLLLCCVDKFWAKLEFLQGVGALIGIVFIY